MVKDYGGRRAGRTPFLTPERRSALAIRHQLRPCESGTKLRPAVEALHQLGAQRLLQSQWIVRRTNTTATGIRDFLRPCIIDANDRLLVTCLDIRDWAGWNLMVDPNTV